MIRFSINIKKMRLSFRIILCNNKHVKNSERMISLRNERTAVVSAQPKKSGQQYRKNSVARYFEPYKKNYDIFLLFLPVLLWYLIFCYLPMYCLLYTSTPSDTAAISTKLGTVGSCSAST